MHPTRISSPHAPFAAGIALAFLSLTAVAQPVPVGPGFQLDPQRGVMTLAPVLGPVLPAVVQILVRIGFDPSKPGEVPADLQLPNISRDGELPPDAGSGSGVVIDAQAGLIITNHHVVNQGREFVAVLADGRMIAATLVGSDAATDVGLLRVAAPDLVQAQWGDSRALLTGDVVIGVGYPFGLEQTATMGIVSGLNRHRAMSNMVPLSDFIQTDAAINKGNSGGALLDSRGRLIGINSGLFSPTGTNAGIGYAIPSRIARAVVAQLLVFGEVRRGQFGAEVEDLPPDAARSLAPGAGGGARVIGLQPNSPAAAASLRLGDAIIRIDGEPVRRASDFRNAVGLAGTGANLAITVIRDQRELQLTARIEAPRVSADLLQLYGATLAAMPRNHVLAARGVRGALVIGVIPETPAARHGLKPGDVVETINQQPTGDVDQLRRALAAIRGDATVTIIRGNTVLTTLLRG